MKALFDFGSTFIQGLMHLKTLIVLGGAGVHDRALNLYLSLSKDEIILNS